MKSADDRPDGHARPDRPRSSASPADIPAVRFYLPPSAALPDLDAIDPDRDWHLLVRGEHVWITQTFLRLRTAGHPVELVTRPPEDGVMVFHAKHRHELLRGPSVPRDLVLVAIRSDSSDPLFADLEVLQNGVFADGIRRHHVPHWPQPGLLPRDPSRGARVERVAFRGYTANLHPGLAGKRWRALLAEEGLVWDDDSVDYSRSGHQDLPERWHDYRDVDVIVALRPPDPGGWSHKPATKLFNAWHTGVPALLGPELAYRELRRSELDYLEVASPHEALAALRRLRDDPRLFAAMVANGTRRSRDYTQERVLACWEHLLFDTVPRLASAVRPGWRRVLTVRQRRAVSRVLKLIRRDPAR